MERGQRGRRALGRRGQGRWRQGRQGWQETSGTPCLDARFVVVGVLCHLHLHDELLEVGVRDGLEIRPPGVREPPHNVALLDTADKNRVQVAGCGG